LLTIFQQIWNWSVVGAVVIVFLLGGGVSFMTSGHPFIADIFFVGGSALFIVRFLTWEEARQLEPKKRLKVTAWALVLTFLVFASAVAGNHRLNTPSVHEPRLDIYYHGTKLDGQIIILSKEEDLNHMFVDPNNPTNFVISGVFVGNKLDLGAEVQTSFLDFPNAVSLVNSPGWRPATAGNHFEDNWNGEKISPQQPPVDLFQFSATPIPTEATQVRLSIFYGQPAPARATFTIQSSTD
jgi:hypothetical protein